MWITFSCMTAVQDTHTILFNHPNLHMQYLELVSNCKFGHQQMHKMHTRSQCHMRFPEQQSDLGNFLTYYKFMVMMMTKPRVLSYLILGHAVDSTPKRDGTAPPSDVTDHVKQQQPPRGTPDQPGCHPVS